jgi:hypothetical protein
VTEIGPLALDMVSRGGRPIQESRSVIVIIRTSLRFIRHSESKMINPDFIRCFRAAVEEAAPLDAKYYQNSNPTREERIAYYKRQAWINQFRDVLSGNRAHQNTLDQ